MSILSPIRQILLRHAPGMLPAPLAFPSAPLFIRRANLVIAWSPKAGCSHVALWALGHEGFFEAASAGALPHDFRRNVYRHDPAYLEPLRALHRGRGRGLTLLKVTRDPKARLVSIFRHAARYRFLHEALKARLGLDPEREGLSLTDLDAYLATERLVMPTQVDPHLRAQASQLWDMRFDRVITLNMDEVPLNASLNAVERDLGLPETDFAAIPAYAALREGHYAREVPFRRGRPLEEYRFRRHETTGFPKRQLMASPLLERMARQHYGVDYPGVGSGDSAGRLFQDLPPARPEAAPAPAAAPATAPATHPATAPTTAPATAPITAPTTAPTGPRLAPPRSAAARRRRAARAAEAREASAAPPSPQEPLPPQERPFPFPPLFIAKANLVVSWSPKAGCSHVALWSFLHEGVFEEASRDPLPHGYRIDVYQKRPFFVRRLRRLRRENGAGLTLLRVTREPKARLVSIFRHAARYDFLHAAAKAELGIDPARVGLSLADLDALLAGLDLADPTATRGPTAADPHLRPQATPLWDLGFDRVITLNMDEVPLNPSLNAVERDLGLPETDFAALPAFAALREVHYAAPATFAGAGIERHRFHRRETDGWPKAALLASPLLAAMTERHYRADLGRVGSGDSAGVLFQPAP